MLRYNKEVVLKLPYNEVFDAAVVPTPFPGKYPTRLLIHNNGTEYLGKPTLNAWRRVKDSDWVEFDREAVVRRGRGYLIQLSVLVWRYYCADPQDVRLRPFHAFYPVRLREGSIYFADFLKTLRPEYTRDTWFQWMRGRIRGDRTSVRPAASALPVPPAGAALSAEMEAAFYRILRPNGALPGQPVQAPPRARPPIPLPRLGYMDRAMQWLAQEALQPPVGLANNDLQGN